MGQGLCGDALPQQLRLDNKAWRRRLGQGLCGDALPQQLEAGRLPALPGLYCTAAALASAPSSGARRLAHASFFPVGIAFRLDCDNPPRPSAAERQPPAFAPSSAADARRGEAGAPQHGLRRPPRPSATERQPPAFAPSSAAEARRDKAGAPQRERERERGNTTKKQNKRQPCSQAAQQHGICHIFPIF